VPADLAEVLAEALARALVKRYRRRHGLETASESGPSVAPDKTIVGRETGRGEEL
jgi:hypothetical protein